ncbi:MAG: hypothetical protein J4428_01010 [Candidatus Aenigmarchaeota archaeon]|nr:hypothetical protein [Candidatus Aenigmarchaeota archaeon]
METNTLILLVIGLVLLVVIFQTFELFNIMNKMDIGMSEPKVAGGFSSQEEMMQAHHGSGSGMQVGGC